LFNKKIHKYAGININGLSRRKLWYKWAVIPRLAIHDNHYVSVPTLALGHYHEQNPRHRRETHRFQAASYYKLQRELRAHLKINFSGPALIGIHKADAAREVVL